MLLSHPICSIFREGPSNVISRNVLLTEIQKILLGNWDRTSSLIHSIFRHLPVLKTNLPWALIKQKLPKEAQLCCLWHIQYLGNYLIVQQYWPHRLSQWRNHWTAQLRLVANKFNWSQQGFQVLRQDFIQSPLEFTGIFLSTLTVPSENSVPLYIAWLTPRNRRTVALPIYIFCFARLFRI